MESPIQKQAIAPYDQHLASLYIFVGLIFATLVYRAKPDYVLPKAVVTGLFWPVYLAITIRGAVADLEKELVSFSIDRPS
ncbi:hypothetical protein NDA01_28485 [Trichocoleus desertorum AS-A10]|uniref:hypothetical protein n=1 Tax=Trichocoleus desertorum TaxID=1481672 RepID=UPI003299D59B